MKISIDEIEVSQKNKKSKKNEQALKVKQIHTSQTSSEELSPTHFLSVSKLKSSIQNIFY